MSAKNYKTSKNFNFRPEFFYNRFWWQYFVSALILLMGLIFFFVLKSEHVKFSKKVINCPLKLNLFKTLFQVDLIEVVKKNIFCKRKVKTRKLSKILNLEIIKKGVDNSQARTVHYKIAIYFNEEKPLEILETSNKHEIKKKVIDDVYVIINM